MTQSIEYRVEAHHGGECDNVPSVAHFSIDEATASRIAILSEYIKAHDLYKIELWDHRTRFLQFDPVTEPEDAEAVGEENDVRTECDRMTVTRDEFWFAAYIKHTDEDVSSAKQPIGELLERFRIEMPCLEHERQ